MTRKRSLHLGEFTQQQAPTGEQKSELPSLEAELQQVETARIQEGVAAFGLGFVSLTAMAFALRVARSGACVLQSYLEPGMSYDAVPVA